MQNNRKISIVQVAAPQSISSGDYYYRVASPGRALSELEEVKTVVSITNIHRHKETLMRKAEILVINHVCDPDLLPVIAFRKERGLVTVFEVGDNIGDVQPWNLTYQFWQNEENRSVYYKLVSACDALQANNGELLRKFGGLNNEHMLFPNQMHELFLEKCPTRDGGIVVGWGGSYGHLDDLKWVAPVLVSWFKEHSDVKLAIMGSEEIFGIFREIPEKQKIYHKPGTITDYYDFLKTIDIGLAPLKGTSYNRCRSDVKFIEYAAFGVVPVLQDLSPYQNPDITSGTRYLFTTPEELSHVLNQLSTKAELRQAVANKAFEYVKDCRTERQHAASRLERYLQLFPKTYEKKRQKTEILDSFNGYVPYTEGEFEQNLYNGLVFLETRNMPEEARAAFLKAEHLAPDNYLPNLFSSKCVKNPLDQLQKALQKNPGSIKARSLIADTYRNKGDLQAALESLKKLIEQWPDYHIPYLKAAQLLSLCGMEEESKNLNRMADDLKPHPKHCAPPEKPSPKVTSGEKTARRQLYLIMPGGNDYGWGVCGKYLAKELSRLAHVKYLTESFTVENIGDELDYRLLEGLLASQEELVRLQSSAGTRSNVEPLIQAIRGNDLQPWGPRVNSNKKIGYTFFENNILSDNWIRSAQEYFDVIVAGSKWCEGVLRDHRLHNTATIIQGIDSSIFNPCHNKKEYFKDKFVIFSGGKLELRKGQDLVIRAFKHLAEKYEDVLLVNSWYNKWIPTLETMAASKYINFEVYDSNYNTFINKLMKSNGINPAQVICLPPKPNVSMARIYKNTDVGLFPNRCEGGTNLVLMEYMACGKPAIASYSSGHKDILTDENSVLVREMRSTEIREDGRLLAVWDEPDPDEVVEKLEWAYWHREELNRIGEIGGENLAKLTWRESAKQFYRLAME